MKAIYALLGSSTVLSGCAFLEALGEAASETPNVAGIAGEAVTAAVEGSSGGGGAVGALVAAGSVLANVIAGIAIRTIKKMKAEPSRAEERVAVLEALMTPTKPQDPQTEGRRAGD